MKRKFKGFSLIEILIGTVICSIAILPVLMLSRADNFHTSFNTAYLTGLSRAKRIANAVNSTGYKEIIKQSGLTTVGTKAILQNPLPDVGNELKNLAQKNNSLAYLKHTEKILANYSSTINIELLKTDLLSTKVTITWEIPGENNKLKKHQCTITNFIINQRSSGTNKFEL